MDTPTSQFHDTKLDVGQGTTPSSAGVRFHVAGGYYSRFVTLMRIALPVLAASIIALVVAWPQINQELKGFQLGISKITVNDTAEQQILNPHFTGTDSSQRPFNLTAQNAFQQKENHNLIDLSFPKADLTTQAGTWMSLSAKTGTFNRQSEILDLKGDIKLFHDSGYELSTTTAQFNLTAGTAMGFVPIIGYGPSGKFHGKGFRIIKRGKTIFLMGKSKIILYPTSKQRKQR